jgi:hypothetical protein
MNSPLPDIDSYDDEYQQFQWDVYMLIENTRPASLVCRFLHWTNSRDKFGDDKFGDRRNVPGN